MECWVALFDCFICTAYPEFYVNTVIKYLDNLVGEICGIFAI